MPWLSLIKSLPWMLLVGGGAWLWYTNQINQREVTISRMEGQIAELQRDLRTVRAELNDSEREIQSLLALNAQQTRNVTQLQQRQNELTAQRDQYLSIFRRHDLSQLALARPGLIQNRINSGTESVFRDLEEITQPFIEEQSP